MLPGSSARRLSFTPCCGCDSTSQLRRSSWQHPASLRAPPLRLIGCNASIAETVRETLGEEPLEEWTTCVDRVKELGFDSEKAEQIVGQAFGWGRQSYWLNKKENEAPDSKQVDAVLKYLEEELSIKGDDLQKVLKKFPEVINCSIEGRLKANLEHMQKAYYMKPPQAINTVKRRPEVLGFTYDCEGSCEGLCNQCWVRL